MTNQTTKGRYAAISQVRLQIGTFTDNLDAINPAFNYIVDLQDHPQAQDVQEDWYYDPVTGLFSETGDIPYPIAQPTPAPPTEAERTQAAILLNQAEILTNQQTQDKVLAAILLEQIGGEDNA